jgi:hypothetical protein
MKRSLRVLGLVLLAVIRDAHAAKLLVTWTVPTKNTDGTPLTDIAWYRLEWGTCNPDGSNFAFQSGYNVPASATQAWIYPVGLTTVCARIFTVNSKQVLSAPAYATGASLLAPGQPVSQ